MQKFKMKLISPVEYYVDRIIFFENIYYRVLEYDSKFDTFSCAITGSGRSKIKILTVEQVRKSFK